MYEYDSRVALGLSTRNHLGALRSVAKAVEAESAPEELAAIANVMPAPPMPFLPAEHHGKLIVMAMMVYSGDPDAGERVVAPFRKLAHPLADLIRPMRYPEMFPQEEGQYHPTAVAHTMFVEWIDRAAAETIVDYLQRSDAAIRVAQRTRRQGCAPGLDHGFRRCLRSGRFRRLP